MCNHFHLLLEVPPLAESGLSDQELLKRLSAIYSEAFVAGVAKELADASEWGQCADFDRIRPSPTLSSCHEACDSNFPGPLRDQRECCGSPED